MADLSLIRYKRFSISFIKRFAGLFLFALLSLLHFPLIWIGDPPNESLGLYDFLLPVIFFFIIISRTRYRFPVYLKKVLLLFGAFILYSTLSYIIVNFGQQETDYFVLALLLKQYEFLLIIVIAYHFLREAPEKSFHLVLYTIIAIVAVNGFYQLFVTGAWYRLGLINMRGTSSNPGGFVLASSLVMMLHFWNDEDYYKQINPLIFWGMVFVGFVALILTLSLTNSFALFGVLFIYSVIKLKSKFLIVLLILGLGILVYLFLLEITPASIKISNRVFYTLLNPESIMESTSFRARYEDAWFMHWETLTSSIENLLFGLGFKHIGVVDSLYLKLLYLVGVVGTLMYLAPFILFFIKGSLSLRLLMVLFFINSLNGSTTLQSYRTMQVFLIFLVFLLMQCYDRKTRRL